MKGVIFNVVEEVVVELYDLATWDAVLAEAGVDGAYTALGNYEDASLVSIVMAASKLLDVPPPTLLKVVGEYALPHLASRMPQEVEAVDNARAFLLRVNDIIHPEMLKLYPDAQPPEFLFEELAGDSLRVTYRSHRKMDELAEGLIRGCGRLYGEVVEVDVEATSADSGEAVFRVSFHPAPAESADTESTSEAGVTSS